MYATLAGGRLGRWRGAFAVAALAGTACSQPVGGESGDGLDEITELGSLDCPDLTDPWPMSDPEDIVAAMGAILFGFQTFAVSDFQNSVGYWGDPACPIASGGTWTGGCTDGNGVGFEGVAAQLWTDSSNTFVATDWHVWGAPYGDPFDYRANAMVTGILNVDTFVLRSHGEMAWVGARPWPGAVDAARWDLFWTYSDVDHQTGRAWYPSSEELPGGEYCFDDTRLVLGDLPDRTVRLAGGGDAAIVWSPESEDGCGNIIVDDEIVGQAC